MKTIEDLLEKIIFASRWLMAPIYIGLIVCLIFLLYVFIHEIIVFIPLSTSAGESGVILFILNLIDLSLAGNLLLMVIFSGYENFVSKIDVGGHKDKPAWMGKVNFFNCCHIRNTSAENLYES